METKREPAIISQDSVSHPFPLFPPISSYHFPRLFTTNTRATLPELITDSQATIYCQVLPHGLGLTLLSWQPSIQEHGAEVGCVRVCIGERGGCLGWLCAGAGCDVCFGGGCMMSSCSMEGANQTLRKLCHLLLSRSIQSYRSAVN